MEIKVNFNSLQNALNETGATLKYRFSLGKANKYFLKFLMILIKQALFKLLLTLCQTIFMEAFLFIRTFLYMPFQITKMITMEVFTFLLVIF